MNELKTPRGMKDITPNEAHEWRLLRDIVEEAMDKMNYGFITTPIVEKAEIFNRTIGEESDILSKEMYIFKDKGNTELALRPEGTASVCRAYIEHNMTSLSQPVRLAYIGPMFRYDRPQAGRYRQLWQFGAECIGINSPEIDTELIFLQNYIFNNLQIENYILKINSLGGIETRKIFEKDLKIFLSKEKDNLSEDSKKRFNTNTLRIFDSKNKNDQEILKNAPNILSYLSKKEENHFNKVTELLKILNINYSIDPSIVRGLDYYTDTVWEFEPKNETSQSTIGAGGRYNNLIKLLGGKDIPGAGFASGIERSLNLSKKVKSKNNKKLDIYLIPLSEEASAYCFSIINILVKQKYSFVTGNYNNSIKSQLRAANNANAKLSFIIGNNEIKDSSITIKFLLDNKEDVSVPVKNLYEKLSSL